MNIKKSIIDIIKSCDTLQFCTLALNGYPETRIITNKMNDNITALNLHFITSVKSHKYEQILKNPNCCLYYYNPKTRQAIRLFGEILPIEKSEQKKYWRDEFTAFGYMGAEDPHLAMLSFSPKIYKFYIDGEEMTGAISN